MNRFLPDYNDPIVSILLLLGIIFIVATLSYAYSIWKQEQKTKELTRFLDKFDSKECLLDIDNLIFDESMKKPLFLLALAYERSGEYSKAINILLFLTKHTSDESYLKYLAKAYFKAGFLERSKRIYLQILSKYPRDIEALYELELIYEKLNDFKGAKEVLDVLEELGEDIQKFRLNILIEESLRTDIHKRFSKLEALLDSFENKEVIIRELFKIDSKRAFRYYEDSFFKKLIDILYLLKLEQIDLDIISKFNNLRQLYYIKGYLDEKIEYKSNFFALDLLSSAKASGFDRADLNFIYICSSCKNRYPIYLRRCPACNSLFKINIESLVGEKDEKRGNSLL